jgi:uncharacterized membrane protein (DUF373 family)
MYIYTSQKTRNACIIKTSRLMLYREVVIVSCKRHTEHINTLCGQNAVISVVRYTSYWALKCCFIFSQIKVTPSSELFKSLSEMGNKCFSCQRIFRM